MSPPELKPSERIHPRLIPVRSQKMPKFLARSGHTFPIRPKHLPDSTDQKLALISPRPISLLKRSRFGVSFCSPERRRNRRSGPAGRLLGYFKLVTAPPRRIKPLNYPLSKKKPSELFLPLKGLSPILFFLEKRCFLENSILLLKELVRHGKKCTRENSPCNSLYCRRSGGIV